MSLDLTLLPFDHDSPEMSYSHTLLSCVTNCKDLFDDLQQEAAYETTKSVEYLNKVATGITNHRGEVPEGFSCFMGRVPDGSMEGESGYGEITQDPYGKSLKYLTVKILLKYKNHPGVLRNQKHKANSDSSLLHHI